MRHTNIDGIIIPEAESWADALELVRSDYYRTLGRRIASPWSVWLKHFGDPARGFLFYLRLSQYRPQNLFSRFIRNLCVRRLRAYAKRHCLQIPYPTRIGYGLHLAHSHSIIVNEDSVIGSNVTLSQFSTVGAHEGGNGIRIHDEVFIGPLVCTVGNITIGKNACVGAGAVVTKDIAAACTAAGVPAKVLHHDRPHSPKKTYPLPENVIQ